MEKSKSEVELVFVPAPGMGHLVAAVKLAKLTMEADHRLSAVVLIINLPFNYSTIDAFLEAQTHDNPYPSRLTFATLPALSNPPDPSSPGFFHTLISLHKPLVREAVKVRVGPRLAGFVLDMFCSAVMEVATELEVPSYIFFTSGVSLLNLMFYFRSLVDDEGFDVCEEFGDDPNKEFDVPGFANRVRGSVVPAVCVDRKSGCRVMLDHAARYKRCKGILVNSCEELETLGLQTVLEQVGEGKGKGKGKGSIPQVYPVGPILELDNKSMRVEDENEQLMIMQWLSCQPESSVVFICFGSMGTMEEEQVKEIAKGLEDSGHRFLWALRKPMPDGKVWAASQVFLEALPEGFLTRTAHRGKIIGWAPQVSILAHPSVGGFVSHCGWNSTLESLWFGVPMATWPIHSEQQLNAFELVKELGLAVEIRMDFYRSLKTRTQNFTVTSKEVEDGVKKLMSLDDQTKNRIREIRECTRKALQKGGSSFNWLRQFIQDVMSNVA